MKPYSHMKGCYRLVSYFLLLLSTMENVLGGEYEKFIEETLESSNIVRGDVECCLGEISKNHYAERILREPLCFKSAGTEKTVQKGYLLAAMATAVDGDPLENYYWILYLHALDMSFTQKYYESAWKFLDTIVFEKVLQEYTPTYEDTDLKRYLYSMARDDAKSIREQEDIQEELEFLKKQFKKASVQSEGISVVDTNESEPASPQTGSDSE